MSSELTPGYLNDLTIEGPIDKVAGDVQAVIKVGEAKGLRLTCSKCQLVTQRKTL